MAGALPGDASLNASVNGSASLADQQADLAALEAKRDALQRDVTKLEAPTTRPAHLMGEPGTLPPVWCKKCRADVVPEKKGSCPRCGSFLRLNFVARKHPVNVLRRDAIRAELEREYRPATTLHRSTCAHLAATLEQLEVMKPGTPDWQRLVSVSQTLGEVLDGARTADSRPVLELHHLSTAELADRAEHIAREFRKLADREAAGVAYVAAAQLEAAAER